MSRLTARPRIRTTVTAVGVGLLVFVTTIMGCSVLRSESASRTPIGEVLGELLPGEADGKVTRADGELPDGATAFDDQYPGISRLDGDLLDALRAASTAAAPAGVELQVNSGWRSVEYQEQLRREAIDEYGSAAEADRWVATADTSAHVTGDAVDIGPAEAAGWLSVHGAAYGLCRVYGNEPWHFELRPDAAASGCPPVYADPSADPRVH